jgi:hypothetical protein
MDLPTTNPTENAIPIKAMPLGLISAGQSSETIVVEIDTFALHNPPTIRDKINMGKVAAANQSA